MSWKTQHMLRIRAILDGLMSGKPIGQVLQECDISAGMASRIIRSAVGREMIRHFQNIHRIRRALLLQETPEPLQPVPPPQEPSPKQLLSQIALAPPQGTQPREDSPQAAVPQPPAPPMALGNRQKVLEEFAAELDKED